MDYPPNYTRDAVKYSQERRSIHYYDLIESNRETALVPIKLDLEIDGLRVRDHFCWNLYEDKLTPLQFGEILCCDLGIHSSYASLVESQIMEQTTLYYRTCHDIQQDSDDETVEDKKDRYNDVMVPITVQTPTDYS